MSIVSDTFTSTSLIDHTVINPAPLSQLNLGPLDSDTRLRLEEKEQAWYGMLESVQVKEMFLAKIYISLLLIFKRASKPWINCRISKFYNRDQNSLSKNVADY